MAESDARLNERRGRIAFRAWRRGFREADLLLGPFADQAGPTMSTAELDAFEALLGAEDHDIYAWIIEQQTPPPQHQGPLMERLQAFVRAGVADVVAEGAG